MAMLNQKLIFWISEFSKFALIFYLFLYSSIIVFANVNNSKAVYINADHLVLNKNSQTTQYDGVVILWFDDIVIKTSLLTVEYEIINGKQKIKRILMPNPLIGLHTSPQNTVIANSAVYIQDKSELTLQGNVSSSYANYVLKTDKLLYYTRLQNIANEAGDKVERRKY